MSQSSLVQISCPLCGEADSFHDLRITSNDAHIDKYGKLYEGVKLSRWKACGRCGFVHQNPRPSLAALSEFYTSGNYHPPELPADVGKYLRFAQWYFTEKVEFALRARAGKPGTVLEIGCGLGGALRVFADRGWRVVGIEPDPAQAQFARDTLGLEGVRQGLVDDAFDVDEPVDLVFSNHAFEHFADLSAVMRALRRVLRPGGLVFTAIPTYYANRSRLSLLWMNSSHYSMFNHHSLNQLCARHGFSEVTYTYRGWRKEIDDMWHVARYEPDTNLPQQAVAHYEDPRAVAHYVNSTNPLRSVLYAPYYAGYAKRVQIYSLVTHALGVLVRNPRQFARRALARINGIPRTG
jgi:SAM-dependent methyltransferase